MSKPPVITLLTDYGLVDEHVGVCHGVIARICPSARIIDISHGVPRHDVHAGAVLLMRSLLFMPVGVHVAIVDPDVGGRRGAVALLTADRRILVGPDNGLLWPVSRLCGGIEKAYDISESSAALDTLSATFHGRDLFCPVAAELASGERLSDLGRRIDPGDLVTVDMTVPTVADGVLTAHVVGVDEFGSVQVGADARKLGEIGVKAGDRVSVDSNSGVPFEVRVARTFSDVAHGVALLHQDSAGWIALAVNRGDAATRFNLSPGDTLKIRRVDG